jgi:mannose-6-phosphate isomerase-like protein (cupin superfamily)
MRIIDLPKIIDPRGNLSFIESERHVPFAIRRVYWVYDVPGGEVRGGHAYRTNEEFMVALSGSFDVVLDDGLRRKVFSLNRSYYGLYVPKGLWRQMENFSTNALALVLASENYSEEDYIRDYDKFKKEVLP